MLRSFPMTSQMAAHRSGVACGEDNFAGQLTFDVYVILVNSAGLDIARLITVRADIAGHILRRGERLESRPEAKG